MVLPTYTKWDPGRLWYFGSDSRRG